MSLRELAERDLQNTLEDTAGSACTIVFTAPDDTEYTVSGHVSDIGFMFDTNGVPVSGRTVCAMWRLGSMMRGGAYVEPGRGWQVAYTDLSGRQWVLYVTRFEPDRTLGVGRVFLSLDLG